MSYSEIAACLAYAVSVWLAARNNVHTVDRHYWLHFVRLGFWSVQLYADVTLQLFFIATSITGWIHWLKGQGATSCRCVVHMRNTFSSCCFVLLLWQAATAFYSTPLPMHGPLAGLTDFDLQCLAQFMLMGRRIENWYVWLAVNTPAVPLYMTRGLNLTAGLYFLFWINARHGLYQWRKELQA